MKCLQKVQRRVYRTMCEMGCCTGLCVVATHDELRSAKDDFSKRMAALHGNIVKNDKKFEGKMDKLAGVVRANAVRNAKGRSQLAAIMKANKMELKAAVAGAVHKGEVRMMKAEMKLKAGVRAGLAGGRTAALPHSD